MKVISTGYALCIAKPDGVDESDDIDSHRIYRVTCIESTAGQRFARIHWRDADAPWHTVSDEVYARCFRPIVDGVVTGPPLPEG